MARFRLSHRPIPNRTPTTADRLATPRSLGALGSPVLSLGLGLLSFCLVSSAVAQPPIEPPGLVPAAVTRVRAVNGHPVEGVPDGLLLRRQLTEDCRMLVDDEAGLPAAAGTAGQELSLQIRLAVCGERQQGPTGRCRWEIPEAGLSGEAALTGRDTVLQIPLPQTTGIYTLELSCESRATGGQVLELLESIERPLFVTYAAPLGSVSPPQQDWYRRACSWGAGFSASAPQNEVVGAMVGNLYAFGQESWLYGYATRLPDGAFIFNRKPLLPASADPHPLCYCSSGFSCCRCDWQAVVMDQPQCTVGDCFIFADVLQNIAAVLGIGGLTEVTIKGSEDRGFTTVPGLQSIDPAFTGNVTCATGEPSCPGYYFGAHDLRQRGDRFFDPTFNRITRSATADVGANTELYVPPVVHFVDTRSILCGVYRSYDGWPGLLRPAGSTVDADRAEELCPVDISGPCYFAGEPQLTLVDKQSDGVDEQLEVKIEVGFSRAGSCSGLGVLTVGDIPLVRPSYRTANLSLDQVLGEEGSRDVLQLAFGVEPLAIAFEEGGTLPPTAEAKLSLYTEQGLAESKTYTIPLGPIVRGNRLGERAARFGEVDRTPRFGEDGMTFRIRLTTRMAQRLILEGTLLHGGESVANTYRTAWISRPFANLELTFEGLTREDLGTGPLELTLRLATEELATLDSWRGAVELGE